MKDVLSSMRFHCVLIFISFSSTILQAEYSRKSLTPICPETCTPFFPLISSILVYRIVRSRGTVYTVPIFLRRRTLYYAILAYATQLYGIS